jgi:hypothetical protein
MMLLAKIFGQRKDLISNFKKVVLCGKGNFCDITHRIRNIKTKLIMLKDYDVINTP